MADPVPSAKTIYQECVEAASRTTDRPANGMTADEWARRFRARIVSRLTEPGSSWTTAQAEDAARSEYDAIDADDITDREWNDPEGAADESLSYWENDGE